MLKSVAAAVFAAAAFTPVRAQEPCRAAAHDLARASARGVAAELRDTTRAWTGADDAAACSRAGDAPSLLARHLVVTGRDVDVRLLPATVRLDAIGGLPDERGSGSAWLGRGWNGFVRPAAAVDVGRVHLVLAPELWVAQNREFETFPSRDTSRSSFASPWYAFPYSADMPSRLGVGTVTQLEPGQSALWVDVGGIDVGASTSAQRWGPGRHGGLVLGPDAPGVPRVFARTSSPMPTRLGTWSATGFVGTLTESRFFDRNRYNDLRTLGAVQVGWRRSAASPVGIAVAHAEMWKGAVFGGRGAPGGSADQLTSFSAEVGPAGSGSRAYVEVARKGRLPSLRRFAEIPYENLAYVAGGEHTIRRRGGALLLAAEVANLEQPPFIQGQPTYDFYTSRHLAHGWTNRGQPLGYPTGPGSAYITVSSDWVASRWSAGVFGERTRWNEDALYRQYLPDVHRHDVTVRAGVRGGYLVGAHELTVELSTGKRLNYLFQNDRNLPDYRTVDVSVPQLRIGIAPAMR